MTLFFKGMLADAWKITAGIILFIFCMIGAVISADRLSESATLLDGLFWGFALAVSLLMAVVLVVAAMVVRNHHRRRGGF